MQSKRDGVKATKRAWKRWRNTVKMFSMQSPENRLTGDLDDWFIPYRYGSDLGLYAEYVKQATKAGITVRHTEDDWRVKR